MKFHMPLWHQTLNRNPFEVKEGKRKKRRFVRVVLGEEGGGGSSFTCNVKIGKEGKVMRERKKKGFVNCLQSFSRGGEEERINVSYLFSGEKRRIGTFERRETEKREKGQSSPSPRKGRGEKKKSCMAWTPRATRGRKGEKPDADALKLCFGKGQKKKGEEGDDKKFTKCDEEGKKGGGFHTT